MPNYILEVCVDSIESAINAVEAGADRLEICGNLAIGGGTTPSFGLVRCIAFRFPNISLMVMIRPRCGDFIYTNLEIDVMKEDIKQFREIGVAGVVFGALTPDGTIDVENTKRLVIEATGLQVTFHRAFDMTCNLSESLLHLAAIPGISRVLTSGGHPTVMSSLAQLEELLKAPTHLAVMPGSGVSATSIQDIINHLRPHGLHEVHMSGGYWQSGRAVWQRTGMGMGGSKEREWDIWVTSYESVKAVRVVLDSI